MSDQQDRYRRDAMTLAAIGRALREQTRDQVRLPEVLADAALAAWLRDERDSVGAESQQERDLRRAAGTLALIGLAVERARAGGSPPSLDPATFSDAVLAATE